MGPKTGKKAASAAARTAENAAKRVIPKQLHEIPMRCINLKRRKDRKENMTLLMKALKITPNFIVAYDGLEVLMKGVVAEAVRQGQTEYLLQYLDQFTGDPRQSLVRVMGDANEKFPHKKWGVLACLLSHKKALEELRATYESEDYFLVFEDDCHMCNENRKLLMPEEMKKDKVRNSYVKSITARFNEGFKWICEDCPDWKLIYLGGVFGWAKKGEKEEQYRLTPMLLKGINTMQAHAYIIRRCAIDEVIRYLNEGYATDGALCKYMSQRDGVGCYRFCPDLFAQPGQHASRDSDILPPHIKPLAVSAAPQGQEAIARIAAACYVQSQQTNSSNTASSSGLASSGGAADKAKATEKKATSVKMKTNRSPSPAVRAEPVARPSSANRVEPVARPLKVISLSDSEEENDSAALSKAAADVKLDKAVALEVPAAKDDPALSPLTLAPPVSAHSAPEIPSVAPPSAPDTLSVAAPSTREVPSTAVSPLAAAAGSTTPSVYQSQSQTNSNRVEPTKDDLSHLPLLRAERRSVLPRAVVQARSRSPKLAQNKSLGSPLKSSRSPSRVETSHPTSTTGPSILPGIEVGASSSSSSVSRASRTLPGESQLRISVAPKEKILLPLRKDIPVPPQSSIPVPPRKRILVPPGKRIPVPPRRKIQVPSRQDTAVSPRKDAAVSPRKDTALSRRKDTSTSPRKHTSVPYRRPTAKQTQTPLKAPPAMPKARILKSAHAASRDDSLTRHVDAQSSNDPLNQRPLGTVSKACVPVPSKALSLSSPKSAATNSTVPRYTFNYPPAGRTTPTNVTDHVRPQYCREPIPRSCTRPPIITPLVVRGAQSGGHQLRAAPLQHPTRQFNSWQRANMHRGDGTGNAERPYRLEQRPRGHPGQPH